MRYSLIFVALNLMSIQASIVKGIGELLLHHDYVVIPEYGGFIVRKYAANVQSGLTQLAPPGRRISFNAQLKQNDGILEYWLQKHLKCSRETAAAELNLFTDYCQTILQVKKRLVFDGIGLFFISLEGQLCFEPEAGKNFDLNSYGLSPVVLNELALPVKEEKQSTVFKDRVIPEPVAQQTHAIPAVPVKRNYRRYAMLAVAGLAVMSVMTYLIGTYPQKGAFTAGFWNTPVSVYTPVQYNLLGPVSKSESSSSFVANAEGYATLQLRDKTLVVNLASSENAAGQKTNFDENFTASPFKIVVGCFSVPENAKRLVKRLQQQQFKAYISGTNAKGMQVVSCGGYASKEEALEQLPLVKNTCPNAWIMASAQ